MDHHKTGAGVQYTIRYIFTLVFGAFALWLFANQFDANEMKSLGVMVGLLLSRDGASYLYRKLKDRHHNQDDDTAAF
jgi:hypothetical protein